MALVFLAACPRNERRQVGLAYEEADDEVKSQRRALVAGTVDRLCPLDPGPASFVLIELVDRRTNEVLVSAETDQGGRFVMHSKYLEDPNMRLFLRFGGFQIDLPGTADGSYEARLGFPCAAAMATLRCRRADYALADTTKVSEEAFERLLRGILDACPSHQEAAARLAAIPRRRSPLAPAAAMDRASTATVSVKVSAEQIASTLNGAAPVEGRPTVELEVFFAFDSDLVDPASYPQIAEVAAALQHPSLAERRFIVGGYTDQTGEEAYNLQLSQRRAESVRRRLIEQHSIGTHRLTAIGYGERSPSASNETTAGRARNRRVTLVEAPVP